MGAVIFGVLMAITSVHGYEQRISITQPNTNEEIELIVWPARPDEVVRALETANLFVKQLKEEKAYPGWDVVSAQTKKRMSKTAWRTMFMNLVKSTGKRRESVFMKAMKTDRLPSGISGELMMVRLITECEKKTLSETITLIHQSSYWQLVGYNYQVVKP